MAVNWPGLLAWSTKYHDGTAPSEFKVMSAEDRSFLEKAMEEAFGKLEDPNKVMQEAIAQIKSQDRTEASITTALEVLDRLCDDPDVARNVEKLDGLQPLLDLVGSFTGAIRSRTFEILALLFSNNPNIQEAGFRRGALQLFLNVVKESPRRSDDRSKAFRAAVALTRQVPALEGAFLRQEGGLGVLVDLMSMEEDARSREKAASFVRSVASQQGLQPEEVGQLAIALAPLLTSSSQENWQYREIVSSCASELARAAAGGSPAALLEAVQARLRQLPQDGDRDDACERATLEECANLIEHPQVATPVPPAPASMPNGLGAGAVVPEPSEAATGSSAPPVAAPAVPLALQR